MSNLDIVKAHGLKTCLDETGLAIAQEIYKAADFLRADPCLLGLIGSWGDTLNDDDVLAGLRRYNEMGECFIPEVVAKPVSRGDR